MVENLDNYSKEELISKIKAFEAVLHEMQENINKELEELPEDRCIDCSADTERDALFSFSLQVWSVIKTLSETFNDTED